MGSIAADDIIRITARMLLDGVHDIVSVFHFKALNTNSGTDSDYMDGVATEMDVLYTFLNSEFSNRLSYVNIEGINVTAARLMPAKSWPVLTVGGSAGSMLPEEVAGCVFFRTLRPKTRASKFIGLFTELSNDGGALEASTVLALQTYGNRLVSGFASDASVAEYGAYNTLLDRFTVVDAAIVPSRWRTQKRRRIGVGS